MWWNDALGDEMISIKEDSRACVCEEVSNFACVRCRPAGLGFNERGNGESENAYMRYMDSRFGTRTLCTHFCTLFDRVLQRKQRPDRSTFALAGAAANRRVIRRTNGQIAYCQEV